MKNDVFLVDELDVYLCEDVNLRECPDWKASLVDIVTVDGSKFFKDESEYSACVLPKSTHLKVLGYNKKKEDLWLKISICDKNMKHVEGYIISNVARIIDGEESISLENLEYKQQTI